MKKLVFNVVVITTGFFGAFNKVEAQQGLQIGFEANPQLSYLVNKDDRASKLYSAKSATGGHFGVSAQYGITSKIGVGLNLLYSFQGSLYEWKGQEKVKSLQYIKIPLMLTLNLPFGSSGKMLFIGKIGPQISALVDARLYNGNAKLLDNNYKRAFAFTDFGGVISAGVGYKFSEQFSFDGSVRFDGGFLDAEDKSYKGNIHDPSDVIKPSPASSPRHNAYNMTVGLNLGIRYTFL